MGEEVDVEKIISKLL